MSIPFKMNPLGEAAPLRSSSTGASNFLGPFTSQAHPISKSPEAEEVPLRKQEQTLAPSPEAPQKIKIELEFEISSEEDKEYLLSKDPATGLIGDLSSICRENLLLNLISFNGQKIPKDS